MWQISPFGVLLKSISPDGVVLKDFPAGGCFARKVHACLKQTASGTGEFAVCEGIATGNGDIRMQGEPPV